MRLMTSVVWLAVCCVGIGLAACSDGGGSGDAGTDGGADTDADTDTDGDGGASLEQDWDRDILSTALEVDLVALTATATIAVASSPSTTASFEVQGLTIESVTDPDGEPFLYEIADGAVTVEVPGGGDDPVFVFDYSFLSYSGMTGYMESGVTLIWPYYCGNLFPCHSDPADGLRFSLSVTGFGTEESAVYPEVIEADAPSYQIAWAVGEYSYTSLGTTTNGTELRVWWNPGDEAAALEGTADLVAAFDWFEQTLGPYPFGPVAGSVQVPWFGGGMEHHPYWHVGNFSMSDPYVHIHEAGHGWYGGGVRIECWEDFVLSEGTVTYLTARAFGGDRAGRGGGPLEHIRVRTRFDRGGRDDRGVARLLRRGRHPRRQPVHRGAVLPRRLLLPCRGRAGRRRGAGRRARGFLPGARGRGRADAGHDRLHPGRDRVRRLGAGRRLAPELRCPGLTPRARIELLAPSPVEISRTRHAPSRGCGRFMYSSSLKRV